MKDFLREKEIYRSDASNESIISGNKFPRSIESISNVLPKVSLRSYPAVPDINPNSLDVCETQLKHVRILENLTGRDESRMTKILKHRPIHLVLDVGEESTRAFLFDVVEGSYRFVAVGESQTTFELQKEDIRIGIRQACDHLSQITGLNFSQSEEDGSLRVHTDVNKSSATAIVLPCNHLLTVVVINVCANYSRTGSRDFLMGYPIQIVGEVSIDDEGLIFPALDMIVQLKTDVIYVTGITDINNSHQHEIIQKLTNLSKICIPLDQQPVFINATVNSMIGENQRSSHGAASNNNGKALKVYSTSGQTDSEKEYSADTASQIRKKMIPGFTQVTHGVNNDGISSCEAFGRIIKYLDASAGVNNGVLGINIKKSNTLIAAVQSGNLRMEVLPQCSLVNGISNMHENDFIKEISAWIPQEVNEQYVEEYVMNKSIYPFTIPISEEDLDIEFALSQHILKLTISEMKKSFQNKSKISTPEIQPAFDRIIAAGGILSQGQDLRKITLAMMNAIQPIGATALFLDTHRIVTALGAAAADNPLLAVQVLDSGMIMHLCTLVTAMSEEADGTPILKIRMVCQNGDEEKFEIQKGDFFTLPISRDENANLFLQPYHRCDVGMGAPGRGGVVRVTGGHLGVIIDARGRPLALRHEKQNRIAQIKGWYRALNREIN